MSSFACRSPPGTRHPAGWPGAAAWMARCILRLASVMAVSAPAHGVEFSVRAHGSYVRHAVRQPEEGGDRGDVPDVLFVEAVGLQHIEVRFAHGLGRAGDLEREVEHRLLALCDVGLSVVGCYLVRDQRVLSPNPEDRPVGDDAILALVCA